jgi:formyl-CoA transferase
MNEEKIREFIQEQRKKIANSKLPLRNVRVIDMGSIVAAPYAATILSDFGAEVIKIEPPGTPDGLRFWGVVDEKYPAYWLVTSRNKLPITLNLKHPQGKKIFEKLVERADVLLENMRPKTLDRSRARDNYSNVKHALFRTLCPVSVTSMTSSTPTPATLGL